MSIREQEFPMRRKVYKIFATLFAVAVVGLVEHLDKKSRADEAAVLRQRQAEDEAKVRAGAVREAKGLARERFGGRIAALKAHCQSRESANEKRPNHWLYSKPTHLAYCINPKAGSSTLNSHIEALHSRYYFKGRTRLVTSVQQLHQNELATEKEREEVKDGFWFTNVRHPFDRIAASYYRLVGHCKQLLSSRYCNKDRAPPPLQLARRILSDDVSAMEKLQAYHFQPFGARCDYCAHSRDIDAVIKFETFQEDVEFVARTLNLTDSIRLSLHVNPRDEPEEHTSKEFYSKIPKSVMVEMYEKFREDFDMFGYSPDEHYKMALQDE